MKSELFLGIDQGTSSTKAILLDGAGTALADFSLAAPELKEDGRSVLQDPSEIFLTVVEILRKAKEWCKGEGHTIRAAGLAFQRSGVLAWDSRSGVSLHPMMTWADTTTYPIIQNLGRGVERISVKTGLPTIPNFAGGKVGVLQKQFLDLFYYVATLDSFVLHKLSGRKIYVTDDTMAARTMLYDLELRSWDQSLCRDFKVDMKRLPRINPSISPFTTFEDVPIVASIGDQQAALIGRLSTGRRPLLNLGSIASLIIDTGSTPICRPGLMTSVLASRLAAGSYVREYRYVTEITSPVTGAVLKEVFTRGWAKDAIEANTLCDTAWQRTPEGRAIAYFVNRRASPPNWPDGVPNTLIPKADADTADRVRAIVENVGNLVIRMLEEFKDKGLLGDPGSYREIDVAGGGSTIDYLLQYIADISDLVLHRLEEKEAGARGAALCAWMGSANQFDASAFNSDEPTRTFTPGNPDRRRRYMMWQRLEQDVLNRSIPPHAKVEE